MNTPVAIGFLRVGTSFVTPATYRQGVVKGVDFKECAVVVQYEGSHRKNLVHMQALVIPLKRDRVIRPVKLDRDTVQSPRAYHEPEVPVHRLHVPRTKRTAIY